MECCRRPAAASPLLIAPANHLEIALEWIDAFAPRDGEDVRNWPQWEPLRPRAETLVWRADQAQNPKPTAALMNELALFVEGKGLYSKAEQLYRRALTIKETQHAEDDPALTIYLNNLALVLKTTNRVEEAEPLYRRGLEIEEKSRGENHPYVAIKLNNLAKLLKTTHTLAEAKPLFVRAVQMMLDSYGADHPHYQRANANYDHFLQRKDEAASHPS